MLFLWLGMLCLYPAMAQHGNIWAVGYKKALNFNTKPVSVINTAIVQDTVNVDANGQNYPANLGSVSYSDCDGKLLVYGSYRQLWNKNHKAMKNAFFTSTQSLGLLLVPQPGNSRFLYFFYHSASGGHCNNRYLRYAIIDLNADNGAGEVIMKDIIVGSGGSSCIAYAKHANNKDLWIIQGATDKITKCYLLKDTGLVVTPVINNSVYTYTNCYSTSNYGGPAAPFAYALKVTRDGKNIICSGIDSSSTKLGCVLMYNFDNSSGTINNPQVLMQFSDIPTKTGPFQGNFNYNEISPNDSFIYVTEWPNTGKYSIVQINRYTKQKLTVSKPKNSVYGFQMGPDGQIYYNIYNPATNLLDIYAITKPNLRGTKCAVRKILSDSIYIEFRLPPQTYEPYRQLTFSTGINDKPCIDTASFLVQVDTTFQNLTFYYGDGDSIQYTSPLKKSYLLKHVYKQTGNYYLSLKAKNPNCSSYSYAGDSVFYAKPPKLVNSLKQAVPGCKENTFALRDSFSFATKAAYSWSHFSPETFTVVNNTNVNKVILKDSGWNNLKWQVIVGNADCPNYRIYEDSISLSYLQGPTPKYVLNKTLNDTIKGCQPLHIELFDSSFQSSSAHIDWGDGIRSSIKYPYVSENKIFNIQGKYTIVTTDTSKDGCSASRTYQIEVFPKPTVNLFTALPYQCYKQNDFKILANCNLASTYTWSLPGGSTYTQKKDTIKDLKLPGAGYSTVRVFVETKEGCKDTNSVSLRLMPELRAVFSGDSTAQCLAGNQFTVKHDKDISSGYTSTTYSYENTKGVFDKSLGSIKYNNPGTYKFSYKIADSFNCVDSVIITHRVFAHPQLKIVAQNVCLGALAFLDYNSDMPVKDVILYSGDGSQYNAPVMHKYGQSSPYQVSVSATSLQGCKDSTSSVIRIFEKPVAGLLTDSVCQGEALYILPLCGNLGWDSLQAMDITWPGDSKTITSANKVAINSQLPGKITVRNIVTSKHQCKDTAVATAVVYALPVADFTWNRLGSSPQGIEVQFFDKSIGANDGEWSFGDGNSKTSVFDPVHIYPDSGSYTCSYKVTNKEGCEDIKTQIIRVLPYLPIYIPTAFSPNDDGINDVFRPSGTLLLNSWNLTIYNRWGEVVFEGNNKGWDGLDFKAESCPNGVYVYRLETQGLDKKKLNFKGSLHLER